MIALTQISIPVVLAIREYTNNEIYEVTFEDDEVISHLVTDKETINSQLTYAIEGELLDTYKGAL